MPALNGIIPPSGDAVTKYRFGYPSIVGTLEFLGRESRRMSPTRMASSFVDGCQEGNGRGRHEADEPAFPSLDQAMRTTRRAGDPDSAARRISRRAGKWRRARTPLIHGGRRSAEPSVHTGSVVAVPVNDRVGTHHAADMCHMAVGSLGDAGGWSGMELPWSQGVIATRGRVLRRV